MHLLASIAGILLAGPVLFFFWIGAQTFTRRHERLLALAMMLEAAALLGLSIALIFRPALQSFQLVLLGATSLCLAIVLGIARSRPSNP